MKAFSENIGRRVMISKILCSLFYCVSAVEIDYMSCFSLDENYACFIETPISLEANLTQHSAEPLDTDARWVYTGLASSTTLEPEYPPSEGAHK